jgi:probable rRNA maturation factor
MPAIVPALNMARPDGGDACASEDPEPPIGLRVDVVREAGNWNAFAGLAEGICAAADAVALELAIRECSACVALSSDAHIARLNSAYRGKAAPTNVLSFPAGGTAQARERFLGDLVLADETVRREAAELCLPPVHHMQHLVVHGILHLLGYDHDDDAEADAMEALEVRILARLGVANPYELQGVSYRRGTDCGTP